MILPQRENPPRRHGEIRTREGLSTRYFFEWKRKVLPAYSHADDFACSLNGRQDDDKKKDFIEDEQLGRQDDDKKKDFIEDEQLGRQDDELYIWDLV